MLTALVRQHRIAETVGETRLREGRENTSGGQTEDRAWRRRGVRRRYHHIQVIRIGPTA